MRVFPIAAAVILLSLGGCAEKNVGKENPEATAEKFEPSPSMPAPAKAGKRVKSEFEAPDGPQLLI